MSEELKSNLTSSKHWVRLVYMLLFSFFLYIASFVVAVLVVVQFLFALFNGVDNKRLRHWGNVLTLYIKEVLMFLTYNSEYKAFPFADWPEPESVPQDDVFTQVEAVKTEPEAFELDPPNQYSPEGGSDSKTDDVSETSKGRDAVSEIKGAPIADSDPVSTQPQSSEGSEGDGAALTDAAVAGEGLEDTPKQTDTAEKPAKAVGQGDDEQDVAEEKETESKEKSPS